MQEVGQLQRDQHNYAYRHDCGILELTKEMEALAYRVDVLHDFVTHVGLQGYGVEPFQGRDDARGRARARPGAHGQGEE